MGLIIYYIYITGLKRKQNLKDDTISTIFSFTKATIYAHVCSQAVLPNYTDKYWKKLLAQTV